MRGSRRVKCKVRFYDLFINLVYKNGQGAHMQSAIVKEGKMESNTIDADQQSFQIKEMTANQISLFRNQEGKNKKSRLKNKKNISQSEESSSSQPPKQPQKKVNRFNYKKNRTLKNKKGSKSQCRSKPKGNSKGHSKSKEVSRQVISKNKRGKKQSSEQSEQQVKQKINIKIKQERKKPPAYVPLTPEARYLRTVKENQIISYGNAKMIKRGNKSPLIGCTQKSKQIIRIGVTWWIANGEYEQHNWGSIFSDMHETQIRDLRMPNNRYFDIIKQINHVYFPNLTILNLCENNIKSIELLSRMRCPLLNDLALRQNQITNINCLFRMSLDNLKYFSITDNPILQMDKLYFINSNCLSQIYFEWKASSVICEDISWMVKLKKDQNKIIAMDKIVIQSKNRINQKMIDEMIARKYRKPINDIIKRKMT